MKRTRFFLNFVVFLVPLFLCSCMTLNKRTEDISQLSLDALLRKDQGRIREEILGVNRTDRKPLVYPVSPRYAGFSLAGYYKDKPYYLVSSVLEEGMLSFIGNRNHGEESGKSAKRDDIEPRIPIGDINHKGFIKYVKELLKSEGLEPVYIIQGFTGRESWTNPVYMPNENGLNTTYNQSTLIFLDSEGSYLYLITKNSPKLDGGFYYPPTSEIWFFYAGNPKVLPLEYFRKDKKIPDFDNNVEAFKPYWLKTFNLASAWAVKGYNAQLAYNRETLAKLRSADSAGRKSTGDLMAEAMKNAAADFQKDMAQFNNPNPGFTAPSASRPSNQTENSSTYNSVSTQNNITTAPGSAPSVKGTSIENTWKIILRGQWTHVRNPNLPAPGNRKDVETSSIQHSTSVPNLQIIKKHFEDQSYIPAPDASNKNIMFLQGSLDRFYFTSTLTAQQNRWYKVRVDPDYQPQFVNSFCSFKQMLVDPRSSNYPNGLVITIENDDKILQYESAVCSYEIHLVIELYHKNE